MKVSIKLDVTKIPRERIFIGKKGKYVSMVLVANKGGRDEYGNDGYIKIDLPKEQREAGERGEIVGNWKDWDNNPKKVLPPPEPPKEKAVDELDDSDVPFNSEAHGPR